MHIGCNYNKISNDYYYASEPISMCHSTFTEVVVIRNFSFPLLLQSFPGFIANFHHLFPKCILIFSAVCMKEKKGEMKL